MISHTNSKYFRILTWAHKVICFKSNSVNLSSCNYSIRNFESMSEHISWICCNIIKDSVNISSINFKSIAKNSCSSNWFRREKLYCKLVSVKAQKFRNLRFWWNLSCDQVSDWTKIWPSIDVPNSVNISVSFS